MSRPNSPPSPARRAADPDCEVCRGEGVIRVPLFPRMPVFQPTCDTLPEVNDSYRRYACPECSGPLPAERAHVLEHTLHVDGRIKDPRYHESRRELIARHMADKLLREDFIRFDRADAPPHFRNTMPGDYVLRGRMGAVSKHYVVTMEERVAAHQTKVAEQVIKAAEGNINLWGSALGWPGISKEEACRQVRQALPDVLAYRARWRPDD